MARFGFAGSEVWQQLDTSLNDNPADTMWVVRAPVCLDSSCTGAVMIAVTHWYASRDSPHAATTYDRQAAETVAFLAQLPADQAHVLVGDLNLWESQAAIVCGQVPQYMALHRLRDAGYIDAWFRLHGAADGFTGMTNRRGCGVPEGNVWKRIDYAWSSANLPPSGMTRFGIVPPGEESPSDHYGVIAEYPAPESGGTPSPSPGPPPNGQLGPGDVVIHASRATVLAGTWRLAEDGTAASGRAAENPDTGAAKLTAAFAEPANYLEAVFAPSPGRAYRLWIRGKAARNSWRNDSVFVQFSGSVTASGSPVWRIGTTSATPVSIEECSGCGLSAWGWSDNGYGSLGPLVHFASGGTQTIRIQTREDGITIDQIVLSPELYLTAAPGLPRNDSTIMPASAPPAAVGSLEIVLYASDATRVAGDWITTAHASAAGGLAMRQPDRGATKVTSPSATPSNCFEMTFNVEAGRPYRMWVRGRAERDHYLNDSVYLQFSGSVREDGAAVWRIGTTSGTWVGIEDCSGCGLSGWGWQDNGYGTGVLGPVVYFQTSGAQTLRIQQREDGITIDQIVLSSERYLTSRPGAARNDSTIIPRQ